MELEEFDIEFLAQKMSENPKSPLFARLADLYLVKDQSAEAMELLKEGITHFPNYYAGHLVLGKAYLSFKEYSKAHSSLTKAIELSPFNQTAMMLLKGIPNKPDESTRTTDENYFTASDTESAADAGIDSEPVTSFNEPETALEPEIQTRYEEPAADEPSYTHSADEETSPAAEEEVLQTVEEEFSQPVAEPKEQFPTYDEYFAEHQSRTESDSPIRLDEYLGGADSAPVATAGKPAPAADPVSDTVEDTIEWPPLAVEEEPEPTAEPLETPPAVKKNIFEMAEENEPVTETQESDQTTPEAEMMFGDVDGDIELPNAAGQAGDENEEALPSTTDLDSLSEKLQKAEKIVPEKNYTPKTPVPEEGQDDKAYETDAVSPTLAEIYASQGEYKAAIQAYEILMFSQPEKGADYQKRINELQKKQMEKDGLL